MLIWSVAALGRQVVVAEDGSLRGADVAEKLDVVLAENIEIGLLELKNRIFWGGSQETEGKGRGLD